MHILFITDNFPPESNAPASRTFEHASLWVKMGHRVSVITCFPNFPFGNVYPGYKRGIYIKEIMNGIEVHRVWSYMTANQGFLKRIIDFISFMIAAIPGSFMVKKPDIVIATSPQFFSAVAGYMVGFLKRIPFVFEVRDLWPEQILVVGVMKKGVIIHILFKLANFLYHHAARVVALGDGYKVQICKGYNVSPEQIEVIPNGILPELFSKQTQRDSVRNSMGLQDHFILLYLGTHGLSQKLETILETAKILKAHEDIQFVFIGDGAEKTKLVRMKEEQHIDNCTFLSLQPKEKVPGFYEAADACVIPLRKCDLFQGNYPSKMFESMAMECPIILSADGICSQLLNESNAGICVEPENPIALSQAIIYLKQNTERRKKMGVNGRKFVVENYSREAWAKKYINLMEQVISHNHRT